MAEHVSSPSLFPRASHVLTLVFSAAAFVLLYFLSQSNYLLFHSIIEITTLVIGFSIFVLVIKARKYIDNSYFFVIGIGFFFICSIDLVHTLAYKGMGVFPGATADLPTQLWIAGRYLQAATLLAAPLVIGRKIRLSVLFFGYAAVTALLLGSIWYGIFPHCFIEGQGLTQFKIGSEYLISFILILATIALYQKREYFDPQIFLLLAAANILTIGAELAFTSYISVYGFMNMLGHLFRLAATACFSMAFLVIGQEQPYELLWHRIWQKEKELKDLNATLADRVAVRTRELEETNLRLKEEIDFRKQADENLRLANAYNRSLIEASIDPLVTINNEGKIRDVNAATETATGIPRNELIGTDFSDYFTEQEKAREGYRRVFSNGMVIDYPLEIRHRDGHITPVLYNATIYRDSDGHIKGVFAAARDITQRKQALDALQKSEEKYHTVADFTYNWELWLGNDKQIIYCSPSCERITGYPPEAFIADPALLAKIVHPDDQILVEEHERTAWVAQEAGSVDFRFIHRDGSVRWIGHSCQIVTARDGTPLGRRVSNRDITERKQMEYALRESEEKFRLLYENSMDAIFLTSPDGSIQVANPAACAMLQRTEDEIVRLGRAGIVDTTDTRLPIAIQTRERTGRFEGELTFIRKDGTRFSGEITTSVFTDHNNLKRTSMIVRDITGRKQAEKELARINRALRMLSDSNQALVHITDETMLMNEICRIAVDVGGYRMAWIGFAEQDEAKTLRPVAHAGDESGYLMSANVTWADSERGRGPGGTAIRTGQLSVARNIPVDPAFAPWRVEAMRRGYQSIIALPLTSDGRTFGAMGIYASEAGVFDSEEVKILTELADDLAFGITALRTRARRELAEDALRENEARLIMAQEIGHTGSWEYNLQTGKLWRSAEGTRIIGLLPGAGDLSMEQIEAGIPERERVHQALVDLIEHDKEYKLEFAINPADGSARKVIHSVARREKDASGNPLRIVGVMQDITERKLAEEALRESEEKYHNLYRNAAIGIFHSTFEGRFIDVNPAMANLLGYNSPEEVVMSITNISEQVYAEPPQYNAVATAARDAGGIVSRENRYRRRDGTLWYGKLYLRVVPDQQGKPRYYEGFVEDITRPKQAEDRIRSALAEKEVLLREIHHRVKNNLAGIISIIDLQIDSQTDPAHISLLRDLEARIRSMALVHESLYQTEDLTRVNFTEYTENLTRYLFQIYSTGADIRCRIEMGDITLPIGTALPCGLVMSEIVTNALKYAFPGTFSCTAERGEPCTIALSLTREGKDYRLRISDNGIGIPEGMDITPIRSLGLHLISFIVKHQMRGTLEVSTVNGTVYSIRFPEPEIREHKTHG